MDYSVKRMYSKYFFIDSTFLMHSSFTKKAKAISSLPLRVSVTKLRVLISTGESVEENANLVIRLLIRRPECLGPALRGEGEGLLRAIIDANKVGPKEYIMNQIYKHCLVFVFFFLTSWLIPYISLPLVLPFLPLSTPSSSSFFTLHLFPFHPFLLVFFIQYPSCFCNSLFSLPTITFLSPFQYSPLT